jgi:hypothetical protein
MITTFQKYLQTFGQKIKILPNVAEATVLDVIDSNSTILENLNRKQLREGIRADGTEIKPYYRNILYKGRLRPVDLRNTGAFYQSITVEVTDDTVEIDAKDSKTEKLQTKYGKLILGLTIDNKRLFLQRMTPQINERLHTWLQR